jgi:hypothetical protein
VLTRSWASIRPIDPQGAVNQMVFAGPAVMEFDPQVLARLSEVIWPLGVMRPIEFDFELVRGRRRSRRR